jgi:predicted component of type VI protein secretion system
MELTDKQKQAIALGMAHIASHYWRVEEEYHDGKLQIDEDGVPPRERVNGLRFRTNEVLAELAAMLGEKHKPI